MIHQHTFSLSSSGSVYGLRLGFFFLMYSDLFLTFKQSNHLSKVRQNFSVSLVLGSPKKFSAFATDSLKTYIIHNVWYAWQATSYHVQVTWQCMMQYMSIQAMKAWFTSNHTSAARLTRILEYEVSLMCTTESFFNRYSPPHHCLKDVFAS